jgi:S-DNA-T family DNA segregation ATPase FtsK/SpoIIIE
MKRISIDRQLDILGVILALVGLLTLLSLFSSERSQLTGWWVRFVNQVAGWGSFILPVALTLLGIWLVLRNVERLPMLSAERLTGVSLIYLNVLAWMHLLAGGGWALAADGDGGGFIGGFFEQLTTAALGRPGAYVVFAGWSLIAIALALDISVSELFRFFQNALASLARRANHQLNPPSTAAGNSQPRGRAVPELDARGRPRLVEDDEDIAEGASSALPPDFRPMHTDPMPPRAQVAGAPAAGARPARTAVGRSPAGTDPAATDPGLTQSAAPTPSFAARSTPLPPWKLPPVEAVLEAGTPQAAQTNKDEEERRSHLIEETLASFGAPVRVVKVNAGPTVTQYGVEPLYIENRSGKTRVRVSKIVALADDLALALAAPRIRIQAPVPGRNYVGIEVPNLEISRVTLRDVMDSETFRKIKSPLRFALGKDVSGHAKAYDLAGMPHLLIAGTTGSGKSVCVNSILTCLLLNNTPTELRMILVDPKRVELTGYNGIPHLLAPVIVEAEEVVGALQWVQREMDARYHRFSQVGARNIVDYNSRNSPPLPYMLVLVDELADLMMLAPDETERSLSRLAQLARATGIHLVLATQRPSVDVVTGLIKANFPARVAFAVASGIDSRVILDQPGAERLLGRGDMLFHAPDAAAPVRLQGVYVSDGEIQDLVEYWRQQAYDLRNVNLHTPTATPVDMELPPSTPLKQTPLFGEESGGKGGDPITAEAIRIVRAEGKASISMLQRKLRIGYTRSARLIDQLEEQGIIGPSAGASQVREVLDFGEDETPAGEDPT